MPRLPILLILLCLVSASGFAQQGVPPPPERTPIPDAENPNLEGLSREERKKRQETLIRKMMQERQREKAGLPPLQPAASQPNAAPQPQAPQSTQPGGAQAPRGSRPAGPNVPPGSVLLQKQAQGEGAWVAKNISSVFDKQEGYRQVTLFLDPASVVADAGANFVTQCKLLSLDKSRVNRVALVLKYPPDFVEPLSIHDDLIAPMIDGTPTWGIDREAGEIRYAAKFTKPLDGLDNVLVVINWKALKPAENLEINLAAEGARSAAYWGTRLLTENSFGKGGGLLGAALRINAPEGPVPKGNRLVSEPIAGFSPALARLGDLGFEPPRLSLDYERKPYYDVDDWIVIDARLDNPAKAVFDEVRLALRYDPDDLEIIDADERNLIKTGVNILDGPFREFWNWDMILANKADPARGVIEYRVGSKAMRRPPSGVLVRVVARVKRTTRDPLLRWEWHDGGDASAPTTGVYLLGESLFSRDAAAEAGAFPREAARRAGPALPAEKADPNFYR